MTDSRVPRSTTDFSEVKKAFSGRIILPEDAEYEAASTTFAHKGTPAVIFECLNSDDVAVALRYTQDAQLVISVRSGGHSNAGLSTNDGGAIIDVSRINKIQVIDEAAHRVRVGAGATWGDIGKALQVHGLALSAGDTVTVGASGLILGGGIGWMVRKYGLAIDSLLSAEIVTADGELLTVDAANHADLFWAIRGGGGNFGVVTALEFTAHPTGDVYFGSITYAAQDPVALLRGWRDCMRAASEDLTTTALLVPSMAENAPSVFVVTACWAGADDAAAQAALAPLRNLPGAVVKDDVKKEHYYEVLAEAHAPQGVHVEVNNCFFHELSDALVDKLAAAFNDHEYLLQVRALGGAMNRVPADATAFAYRDSEVMVLLPLMLPLDSTEEQIQAALKPWHDLAKDSQGGYVNFFGRASEREVAASYPPETRRRLAAIKYRYDPANIFARNLNIKPQM